MIIGEEEYDEYLSLLAGEWEQEGSTPDNILDEMVHDYYLFRANGSGKYIQYRSSNGKIISNKEFTFTYDGELLTVQYTVEGDGNSKG